MSKVKNNDYTPVAANAETVSGTENEAEVKTEGESNESSESEAEEVTGDEVTSDAEKVEE